MKTTLKPSATHFLQYDAATFENEGFKTLNGRISQLALEPRFWSVSVKVVTETVDVYRVLSLFQVNDPCIQHAIKKLLCAGDQVKKEVLDKDDYLPVCTQCLVTARVMM